MPRQHAQVEIASDGCPAGRYLYLQDNDIQYLNTSIFQGLSSLE